MTQRGFSSILLIAIIVLLAGMSSFALRFVAGAQGNAATDLQAFRVQQAAEAALEWQRYRVRSNTCAAATTLVVPFSSGGITATVNCSQTPAVTHVDGANNGFTYLIKVTACWPAGPAGCPNAALPDNYIERKITATAACVQTTPLSCTW